MSIKLFVLFQIVCFIPLSFPYSSLENDSNTIRIVGGLKAAKNQFPCSVVLLTKKWKEKSRAVCTGTIITNKWVLTAAHCHMEVGRKTSGTRVIAGATDYAKNEPHTQTRNIVQIINHDKVSKRIFFNMDIALAKVDKPFVFNAYVKPVPLAKTPFPSGDLVECRAMGYGIIDDDGKIRNTKLYFFKSLAGDYKFCGTLKPALTPTKEFLCLGANSDRSAVCSGDSGGPLICQGTLAGVLNGQIFTAANKSKRLSQTVCSSSTAVTVYMFVGYFEKWLRKYIPELPEFKLLKRNKPTKKWRSSNNRKEPNDSGTTYLMPNLGLCIVTVLSMYACQYILTCMMVLRRAVM